MTNAPAEFKLGQIGTRPQICAVYGGSRNSGGIVPSRERKSITLFSDHEVGVTFGYHDGWLAEEDEVGPIFEYTGAGKKGHQTFTGKYGGNNAAVRDHVKAGRRLHVFVAVDTVPGTGTKRHRYVGEFTLDTAKPYVVRESLGEDKQPRRAIVFRLRPVGIVQRVAEDEIPPAAVTGGKLVAAAITACKLIEPEKNTKKKGKRSAVPEVEAQRREAYLSDAFEAYLTAQQHTVGRFQIKIKGRTSTLLTDLYDQTDHVLYELKGTNTREAVRMALGQLLDYGRYVKTDEHPEMPRRVVLLPSLPDEDLQELLADHGIGIAYQDGDTFIGVPPSLS
ncbi:hypothetical protein [Streptomyces sp. NRRL B-24484]|uniref:hypothetical protein n=1 Tax=Streptomyces sp. NRRL B-24484 TaxID=1463833 RepID=UPI000693C919|nr:hypothetical protein [Streptomyces sp. NRRL B-24484]